MFLNRYIEVMNKENPDSANLSKVLAHQELARRWWMLCYVARVKDQSKIEESFVSVIDKYIDDSNRHYHGIDHVLNVLNSIDEFIEHGYKKEGEKINDLVALYLAAWCHDAIYIVGSSRNEEDSGFFTYHLGMSLGISEETCNNAMDYVYDTRHINPPYCSDSEILCDADLVSLGAKKDIFDENSANIRLEYSQYPDEMFYPGRAKFLKGMLKRDKIFHKEYFRERFETKARENMEREMKYCSLLNIQRYILDNGWDKAQEMLKSLEIDIHEEVGRNGDVYVHFDYGIGSPKGNVYVNECRGIALDRSNWEIVRFGYNRFMNYREVGFDPINFNAPVIYEEKVDGSIIMLSWFDKEHDWIAGTRGKIFPKDKINGFDINFSQLFWRIFPAVESQLKKRYCYVFELCSLENRVVLAYEKSQVVLLTVRDRWNNWRELDIKEVDNIAEKLSVRRPMTMEFKNVSWCVSYLDESKELVEGFVARQWNENLNRWCRGKIKSSAYIALHNIVSSKSLNNLVKLVLQGKRNSLKDFSEYLSAYDAIDNVISSYAKMVDEIFEKLRPILEQKNRDPRQLRKEFAHEVVKKPYSAICFAMADGKVKNTLEFLRGTMKPGVKRPSIIKDLIRDLKLSELVGETWKVVEDETEDI